MRKKIVLDTNVFLNYIDHSGDGFEVMLRVIEKCVELEIITCPEMLKELIETLCGRRKFPPKYADMVVRSIIRTFEGFEKLSIFSYSPIELDFDMNRKDKYFCEFAVQVDASYVVSNDERHFTPVQEPMQNDYNILVLTCRDFLSIEGHLDDWNRFRGLGQF